MTEFIAHRINDIDTLKNLDLSYGVEIDLRDNFDGSIYLSHDPFKHGTDFEDYLKNYKHQTIILNIKSERIELKILNLINKCKIKKYFFLDSSFPMIKLLSDLGNTNIALRFSEFEGLDTIYNMRGKASWVWVDCFSCLPLDKNTYEKLKTWGYKICIVSPELQSQEEKIELYAKQLNSCEIVPDAICCKQKNINKWKQLLKI
jgi:hypothetical protein